MNLTQLYYFTEVSKSLNVSATARQLHVSQPAISRGLHDLEKELQVQLFIRQGRNLTLTSQGSYFSSAVRQFFSQLMAAKDNVKKIQALDNQQVIIKMRQTTPLLVPFIKLIQGQLPDIHLKIIQSDLKNDEQYFDFQMVPTPVNNQINELLLEEEVCLAVKKGTIDQSSISQGELNGFSLLQLDKSPFADLLQHYLNTQDIHPHYLLRSGDRGLLLQLVAAGYGGCLVPKLSWSSLINHDKIDLLRIGNRGFHRHIYLSYSPGPRTKKQQEVHKLLVTYCHNLTNPQ